MSLRDIIDHPVRSSMRRLFILFPLRVSVYTCHNVVIYRVVATTIQVPMSWFRTAIYFAASSVTAYLNLSFFRQTQTISSFRKQCAKDEMSTPQLKFLTVAPRAKHTATVIIVHVCQC